MIKVIELYVKRAKGQPPEKVESLRLLEGVGVDGDIFANGGKRQLSLLLASTRDEIAAMDSSEACLRKFTCNLVLAGCELSDICVGKKLGFGGCEIEITAVGRQCHGICALGSCPLVSGAIFAEVVRSGVINQGDEAVI